MGKEVQYDFSEGSLSANLLSVVMEKPLMRLGRGKGRKDGAGVPTRKREGAERLTTRQLGLASE